VTLSFDTNVLVYATERRQSARGRRARTLIARGMHAGTAVLLLQSLTEFSSVAIRKAGIAVAEVQRVIESWRAVLPVHPAAESDLYDALDMIRSHHLSFWDALLWASARRVGVRHLLSEDFQDGQSLDGVRFINPFVASNDRLIDELLPD
jgi:predicted nucleic acid-binding protein